MNVSVNLDSANILKSWLKIIEKNYQYVGIHQHFKNCFKKIMKTLL